MVKMAFFVRKIWELITVRAASVSFGAIEFRRRRGMFHKPLSFPLWQVNWNQREQEEDTKDAP